MKDKRIQVSSLSSEADGKVPYKASSLKSNTWGSIFLKNLSLGYDHGYAAHLANQWEDRQKKKITQALPCC